MERVETGTGASSAPPTTSFDVVLLDLGLPDRDGFDVCRELHARSDVPIIVVTARLEEVDRVVGLELGADDYIVKPFGFRELVARIRAVAAAPQAAARAASPGTGPPLQLGGPRRGRPPDPGTCVDGADVAHAEGVRPARVPRRGPGRSAAASRCSRGVGPALVRADQDARRPRGVPAQEARRRGWIETVRGVGFRLGCPPTPRHERRLLLSYLSITAFVLLVLEIPLGVS